MEPDDLMSACFNNFTNMSENLVYVTFSVWVSSSRGCLFHVIFSRGVFAATNTLIKKFSQDIYCRDGNVSDRVGLGRVRRYSCQNTKIKFGQNVTRI